MGRKRKTLAKADVSSSPQAKSKPRTIQETSSQQDSFVNLSYEGTEGSDREYPIRCIIDESRGKYLIAWEGPYTPTWEPKHFANDIAVEIWENKKIRGDLFSHSDQGGSVPRKGHGLYQGSTASSPSLSTNPSTVPETDQDIPSEDGLRPYVPEQPVTAISPQGTPVSGNFSCTDPPNSVNELALIEDQNIVTSQSIKGSRTAAPIENLEPTAQIDQDSSGFFPISSNPPTISRSLRCPTNLSLSSVVSSDATDSSRQLVPSEAGSLQGRETSLYTSRDPLAVANSSFITTLRRFRGREYTIAIAETPQGRLSPEEGQVRRPVRSPTNRETFTFPIPNRKPFFSLVTPSVACISTLSHQAESEPQSIPETIYRESSSPNLSTNPPTPTRIIGNSRHRSPYLTRNLIKSRNRSISLLSTPGGSETRSFGDTSNFSGISPESTGPEELDIKSTVSWWLGHSTTMDDSAPDDSSPRPLSSVAEAARNIPGNSYRERMKYLRARDRASIKPLRSISTSATPSSAGDIEASAPPTVSEAVSPLSIRLDKETTSHDTHTGQGDGCAADFVAPQALHYSGQPVTVDSLTETSSNPVNIADESLDTQTYAEGTIGQPLDAVHPSRFSPGQPSGTQVGGIPLGPSEFAIPLSMDSRVKDDYDTTLANEAKAIAKFLRTFPSAGFSKGSVDSEVNSIVSKMEHIVEQLNNITTHPDLNLANHITGATIDVAREALWAEYSSSKFQFLGYFIDAAVKSDLHVIIMAKEGKTVRIVENYLLGKGFIHFRPRSEMTGKTELVLSKGSLSFGVRSTSEGRALEPLKDPAMIIALDNSFDGSNPSVKHVRAASSQENGLVPVIRLIVANTTEHIELCLPTLSDINRLRLLIHCTTTIGGAAGELQDNALGVQENAEEVLLYLTTGRATRTWPLAPIEAIEIENITETVGNVESDQFRFMLSSRQKRWTEVEGDDVINPSKRQKMTPMQDISHVSDSVKDGTQDIEDAPQILEKNLIQTKNEVAIEIKKLQSALIETRVRLQKSESVAATLQHRYESRTKELHKIRQERDRIVETSTKSDQRLERQKHEISKLKEERSALIKDLETARDAIKEGGGLAADVERSREEIRKLSKANSSLEKAVKQEQAQTEYTRQQYQNASAAAAQSAMEVSRLSGEIVELKRKASGDAIKLRQLKLKNDEQRHFSRIKELEATLASRDELLTKKEEEIRELKKNRPSTRATSLQPRSPKWTNSRPTSPGPNSNIAGNRASVLRFRAEIA